MKQKCNTDPRFEETRILWGHKWTLCAAFTHDDEAADAKKRLEKKNKIARVQPLKYMGGMVYIVWWRNKP